MRAAGRALLGSHLVLFSTACTLLISTNGFSEPANPDAGDAAPNDDAPVDVSASSSEAGDGGNGRTWCNRLPTSPLFCADFDKTTRVEEGWDMLVADAATGGSDDLLSLSAPRSFAVKNPLNRRATAFLQKVFAPVVTSEVVLDFDILIGAQSYFAIVAIIQLSAGYSLGLALNGQLHEFVPGYQETNFTVVGYESWFSSWRHVTLQLHVPATGSAGWVTIRYRDDVGETVVVDHHPVTTTLAAGAATLKLGIVEDDTAWAAHFDNVTFDVK